MGLSSLSHLPYSWDECKCDVLKAALHPQAKLPTPNGDRGWPPEHPLVIPASPPPRPPPSGSQTENDPSSPQLPHPLNGLILLILPPSYSSYPFNFSLSSVLVLHPYNFSPGAMQQLPAVPSLPLLAERSISSLLLTTGIKFKLLVQCV